MIEIVPRSETREISGVEAMLQALRQDPITPETLEEMTEILQEMARSNTQAPFTEKTAARWARYMREEQVPDCILRAALKRVYLAPQAFCPSLGELLAVCQEIKGEIIRKAEVEWFWEKNADTKQAVERSKRNERLHLSQEQQEASQSAQRAVMGKIARFFEGHSLGTCTARTGHSVRLDEGGYPEDAIDGEFSDLED